MPNHQLRVLMALPASHESLQHIILRHCDFMQVFLSMSLSSRCSKRK